MRIDLEDIGNKLWRGGFEIVVWPWSSPGESCSPGELSGQE